MTYQAPDPAYEAEQQALVAHEALRAVGLVLSTNPFAAISADLAHGRLIFTYRMALSPGHTHEQTIYLSGQQLRDLLRLGRLAATPTTCWRCDQPFVALGPDCDVCHHQAHCDRCDAALHPDPSVVRHTGGRGWDGAR